MTLIKDPEVRRLATCSLDLRSDYPYYGEEAWQESPFNWIRIRRSSRQRGTIGERVVATYLAHNGFEVSRSPDSGADLIINCRRVEVKMSTLWKSGMYKFQQLRDQNYDLAVCLGISPLDAHCWVLPKNVVLERWERGAKGIRTQHGGSAGTDTTWLSVNPEDVPDWLNEWGGSLSSAMALIGRFAGSESFA